MCISWVLWIIVEANEVHVKESDWKDFNGWAELHPTTFEYVFKAKANRDPDTLTWDEAMNDIEHLTEWREAAAKEIKQLEDKECWVECQKSEAERNGKQIIPCTWVMRIKRSPSGDITKQKGANLLARRLNEN